VSLTAAGELCLYEVQEKLAEAELRMLAPLNSEEQSSRTILGGNAFGDQLQEVSEGLQLIRIEGRQSSTFRAGQCALDLLKPPTSDLRDDDDVPPAVLH
jgi:hypothetical protein